MKNALVRLSWLITADINPTRISRDSFTRAQLKEWTETASHEYDNIRMELLNSFTSTKDGKVIKGFFHRRQASLINSLNRVYRYKEQHPDSPLMELYDLLMDILQNLIDEIRYSYPEYFNPDEKMPHSFRQHAAENLRGQLAVLDGLMARHDAGEELVLLARKPAEDIIHQRKSHLLTYRADQYAGQLVAELIKWAGGTYEDPHWELLSLLIYMNLNSRSLRNYCLKYLLLHTVGITHAGERLNALEEYYKKFHVLQLNRGFFYNPKVNSLKYDVRQWLESEINLLNKRVSPSGHESLNPVGKIKKVLAKLKTPFTVIQIGFWAHVQMEVGKIQNTSEIEVFRIIADTHETEYQKEISAHSMQKNYRLIDKEGVDELMTYAMAIYNYLKWFKNTLSK